MRFYRALLLLYPVSFRAEYSAELCAAFEREHRDRGAFGAIAMWFAAITDVVPNAFAVHADLLMQDLRYVARAIRRSPGFAVTAVLASARTRLRFPSPTSSSFVRCPFNGPTD
jgi:hypothetical protein